MCKQRELERVSDGARPRILRFPTALRALRHRDFALFWVGLIVSATGMWMQGVAMGWLIYELTQSKLYLGLVGMMGTLPILLFSLPAGVFADRISKRKIVICTQSAAMFQALILAILVFSGAIHIWHIVVLAAVGGVIGAIDVPARQSMTIELSGRDDLPNAIALNSSGFNIARILGPAAAGVVVAVYGTGMCFLINAITYVAILISLFLIAPTPVMAEHNGESMLSQIREGVRYVRGDRVVKDLIMMTGAASIFALQYGTLMPALAKEVLGVNEVIYGILMAAPGVGALLGGVSVASLGHLVRQGTLATAGAFLVPLGLIGVAFSRDYIVTIIFIVFVGLGMMLFLAVSNSIIQMSAPDNLRGRVVSLRTLVFMGFTSFGSLAVGAVSQQIGVPFTLAIGSIAFLCTTTFLVLRSPEIRKAS